MKKFLSAFLCALTVFVSALGLTSCAKTKAEINVYMPDGATALAMAKLMVDKQNFGKDLSYNVVDGSAIQTYVTGESPAADVCVLPLNLASKLLGNGETYRMLGTVTHGNLFVLKKSDGEELTVSDLSVLNGKTAGVVQLAAVPGLTFEIILKDNNLEYNVLDGGESSAEKVNLKAVTAAEVIPSNSDCDYFVVPEPAATAKVNATKGALSFAASLQTLYGGENGYPQAVLVAKKSLIEKDGRFINDFISAINANTEWLLSDGIDDYFNDIVGAINENMANGSESSLNAKNLNKQVIKNCAINFVASAQCKTEVNAFIDKLIAVNAQSAAKVEDKFYFDV